MTSGKECPLCGPRAYRTGGPAGASVDECLDHLTMIHRAMLDATAPKLLEALNELRDTAWSEMDEDAPEDSRLNRTLKMLADIAGTAIAKAEGR